MEKFDRIIDYTNHSDQNPKPYVWLRRFAKLLVASTLFLIFAGGMVTSTGSGLSVPDWPNTYGKFMFAFPLKDMVGGIFYEHSHRMIASIVGLLTVILAVWVGRVEKRKWVRVLAFCALAAVITQGLLGGLTVLFFLPTAISMSHAILAQSFFCITIIIAYSLSKERRFRQLDPDAEHDKKFGKVALVVTGLVYIQLILGALMRHTHSGLAIPDFPTMGGSYWPVFNEAVIQYINSWRFDADLDPVKVSQVWIHFIHRIGAVFVSCGVLYMIFKAFKTQNLPKPVIRTAMFVLLIVVFQFSLGVITVLSGKQPHVTSLHVVTGAFLLGSCVLLTLRALPLSLRKAN